MLSCQFCRYCFVLSLSVFALSFFDVLVVAMIVFVDLYFRLISLFWF